MSETGDSFHAALNRCHTSSTVLLERSSRPPMVRFLQWMTDLETVQAIATQFKTLYIEKDQNTTCNTWSCIILLEDGVWQALKIRHNHWM
ncbi:hypothetical protein TNCV_3735661 [Trichonephila clavipes]|nr:hypothetical protein TNCV_3735661 [Trichonephila clavipes]